MDLDGIGEEVKDDAFLFGVEDFFAPGRELLFASAVDDMGLSAEAEGSPCRVHSHVAAADDDSLFGLHDRSSGIGAERLHQIAPGEIFVGGEDAHGLLAGNVHKLGKAGAGTDEYGIVALFLHQGINGSGLADDAVCLDLDTKCLDILDLLLDDRFLGKTEFGDAVDENAARLVQGFENSDVITHAGQITCAGEAGGAGTDDGDLFALGGCIGGGFDAHGAGGIRHIALQLADGDGLSLDTADADAFALALLRTYTAADSGQSGGLADHIVGAFNIALFDFCDKTGNIDGNGTSLYAAGLLAVEAAGCFGFSFFFVVSQAYFFKIRGADFGILFANRNSDHHILCHNILPSCISMRNRDCTASAADHVPQTLVANVTREISPVSRASVTISRSFRSRRGAYRLLLPSGRGGPLQWHTGGFSASPGQSLRGGRRIQGRPHMRT